MIERPFGFYPSLTTEVVGGSIRIVPLPDHKERVRNVMVSCSVEDGWFHPSIYKSGIRSEYRNYPYGLKPTFRTHRVASRYELPCTHTLVHKGSNSMERMDFLISCLGLLVGLHLLPDGHGHFYKTPILHSKLSDCSVRERDIAIALSTFDAFWMAHGKKSVVTTGIKSAIHTLHTGQCYEHLYEQLLFLVMALDATVGVYKELSILPKVGQWRYAAHLCKHLGIPCPRWVRKLPKKRSGRQASILSVLRNELIHEATVDGQPIGYRVHTEFKTNLNDVCLELSGLLNRALLNVLGIRSPYISSSLGSRQIMLISLNAD